MTETKYIVKMDDRIIAKDMVLEDALVLVEGLFNKYFAEPGLAITIERQDYGE